MVNVLLECLAAVNIGNTQRKIDGIFMNVLKQKQHL